LPDASTLKAGGDSVGANAGDFSHRLAQHYVVKKVGNSLRFEEPKAMRGACAPRMVTLLRFSSSVYEVFDASAANESLEQAFIIEK
jgi:hypothetical protein